MTRSAAAPAAAKTISTIVGPPRCVETGGGGLGLPPPREPLDDCSGGDGEWILAGESGEPRDLGGGGGEEALGSGGAGEDEAAGGGDGGGGESADGGWAAEGPGLLFGGDGAAGGLVEELDAMARHETINLHELSRPCRAGALAHVRASPTPTTAASPAGGMRGGGSRNRNGVAAPPPSRSRARTTPRSSSGQARRARSPGVRTVRAFHPAAISRGAKNSLGGDPNSPALLALPCFCCVLLCCLILAGGWCLPHLQVVSCEAAGCMAAVGAHRPPWNPSMTRRRVF
jgi:hypothetical protein